MNGRKDDFYIDRNNPSRLRIEKLGLTAGIIGLAFSAIGIFADPGRFFHSYLVAFGFWTTISLGCLFFVMLHHLTGATWSVVVRRQAETVMSILPILAIFFVPVLFGMHDLYHWTHADAVAGDHLLHHKSPYLNVPFFLIRAAAYFGVWTMLALLLYKVSLKQDSGHSAAIGRRVKRISAPGMLLFAISVTYSSFDWYMSQDPHWYSTIFGAYIFSGGLVSALAFLAFSSLSLRKRKILSEIITEEHYHDLGKLTFAFMVFWAYIAFSQYFLIWYANIPEETIWFDNRYRGGWKYVSILIALGYFVLPFLLLMARGAKRKLGFLKIMAGWLLFMHWVDLYWIIMPVFSKEKAMLSWIDIAAMLGIGGIFMWIFWRRFFSNALVPVGDPRLESSIKFVNY